MNQRVHNLSKWRLLPEGQSINYPGRRQRTVILEVNCPDEVAFYIVQDAEDIRLDPEKLTDQEAGRAQPPGVGPQASLEGVSSPAGRASKDRPIAFLGLAKGRDRFEFAVEGSFELFAEGGSAYVFTHDGEDIATRIVAPEIYTRIANRRQRNPHLEMIQFQLRLNQERMMRQLEEESNRRIEALEAKVETYAPQRDLRAPADRLVDPADDARGVRGDDEEDAGEASQSAASAPERRPVGRPKGSKRTDEDASSD